MDVFDEILHTRQINLIHYSCWNFEKKIAVFPCISLSRFSSSCLLTTFLLFISVQFRYSTTILHTGREHPQVPRQRTWQYHQRLITNQPLTHTRECLLGFGSWEVRRRAIAGKKSCRGGERGGVWSRKVVGWGGVKKGSSWEGEQLPPRFSLRALMILTPVF